MMLKLFYLLSAGFFHYALGQVAYPEAHLLDVKKANLAGRTPLYSPTRCKSHELLYPGDQQDDWICDCAPAALYYPETDACYPAFKRGPCNAGQILVLRNNDVIPICAANECKVDGQIKIKGTCYELGKPGPCPNPQLSYVLGVDPKTIHIDCVKLSFSLASRFDDTEPEHSYDLNNIEVCSRGSKRAIRGRCPQLK